jgi:hypothetical protein
MQSQTVDAQRAAIGEVRVRFERGEIAFDAFQRAMDALLLAQTPDECQAILAALPPSPGASLAALDPAPAAPTPVPSASGWKWMFAFLGEAKRMRRPWKLAAQTLATALVGEVKLDLSLAALPRRATIRAAAIVGEVTLYVPRSAHVRVHGLALVGEVNALGERSGGIVSFAGEEHTPDGPAECDLEIEAVALVGEVKIVLVDGPVLGSAPVAKPRLLPQT